MAATPIWIVGYGPSPPAGPTPVWIAAYGGSPDASIGATEAWIVGRGGPPHIPAAGSTQVWITAYGAPSGGATPIWISAYGGAAPAPPPPPFLAGSLYQNAALITLAVPVTTPVAAGAAVVAHVFDDHRPGLGAGQTVTDSQGNVYSSIVYIHVNNAVVQAFIATLATALTTSDTVTYTSIASNQIDMNMNVIGAPGYGAVDTGYTATASGTTTTYSVTGAAIPQKPNSLNIGMLTSYQHPPNLASGWTALGPSSLQILTAYQVAAGSPQLTFAGTIPVLAQWTAAIVALEPQ